MDIWQKIKPHRNSSMFRATKNPKDQLLSASKLPCWWFLDPVSQSICPVLTQSALSLDSAAGKEILLFPSRNLPQCLLPGKQNYLFVHAVFKYRKTIIAPLFARLSQTVLSHFSGPLTALREWDAAEFWQNGTPYTSHNWLLDRYLSCFHRLPWYSYVRW